jgi:hypothetical protein
MKFFKKLFNIDDYCINQGQIIRDIVIDYYVDELIPRVINNINTDVKLYRPLLLKKDGKKLHVIVSDINGKPLIKLRSAKIELFDIIRNSPVCMTAPIIDKCNEKYKYFKFGIDKDRISIKRKEMTLQLKETHMKYEKI